MTQTINATLQEPWRLGMCRSSLDKNLISAYKTALCLKQSIAPYFRDPVTASVPPWYPVNMMASLYLLLHQ